MELINYKIQFIISVKQLFRQLEPSLEYNLKLSRYHINRCAKDVSEQIKNLNLTNIDFKKWKEYKQLSRDLPSYEIKPNIKELEDLKKLIQLKRNIASKLTFNSLFKNPEHPEKVKKILEDNYYTKDGIWIYNGNENTLATAYYVLSDPVLKGGEIHAIILGKPTPQLIAFYKEFGLKIAEKKQEDVYTTIIKS
jgi:hypothetical protein